jgi:hypothetical protein
LNGGWVNVSNGTLDDIDWRVFQGSTPSSTTGPDVDHTSGTSTGKYVYLEASGCYDQEAVLLSPCYDLSAVTAPSPRFWYHMYGGNMGELHVYVIANDGVYSDFIPPHFQDQGNFWRKDSANLSQFIGQTVSIRFRGITGADLESDMALDDIGVYDAPTAIDDVNSERSFAIYPNPASGVFNFYSLENNHPVDITILDMVGNTVSRQSISGKGIIDLSSMADGIYTAIIHNDKVSKQIKLMKLKD